MLIKTYISKLILFVMLVFLNSPLTAIAEETLKPFEIEIGYRREGERHVQQSFRVMGDYNSTSLKNVRMAFPTKNYRTCRNVALTGSHITAFFDFALDHHGGLWIKRLRVSSQFLTVADHLESNDADEGDERHLAFNVSLEGAPFTVEFPMKGLGNELDMTMSQRAKFKARRTPTVNYPGLRSREDAFDWHFIQRSKSPEGQNH